MTVVHLILTDAETDRCRRGLFGGLATFRFLKGGIPRAYPAWDLSILGMQGSGLPHSLPIVEGWASFFVSMHQSGVYWCHACKQTRPPQRKPSRSSRQAG